MRTRKWRDGDGTLTVDGGLEARRVPLRIAASYRTRARGLLGRDGIDGALLITPCASVHTFRMRFAIDVAYLDRQFTVLAVRTMKPGRLGLPACGPAMWWRRRRGRWSGGGYGRGSGCGCGRRGRPGGGTGPGRSRQASDVLVTGATASASGQSAAGRKAAASRKAVP